MTRDTVPVQPETLYTRSGDVSIAYQVTGEGPFDVVFIPPFVTHVELVWTTSFAPALRALSSFCRLIRFDKRGTGMSDRAAGAPTLKLLVANPAGGELCRLVGLLGRLEESE